MRRLDLTVLQRLYTSSDLCIGLHSTVPSRYSNDLHAVREAAERTAADYVTFDVESLPDFYTWADVGHTSENFARRKLPGNSSEFEFSPEIAQ